MTRTNSIAKVAAVAAMLGLVVMSFASFAPAARAAFMMDLTMGSTGSDVTALQTWLIAGGYSIPAGATGYFGAQTQAALAAYQAANGISPAAGYFGPITRAKVNAGGSTGSTGGSTGSTGGSTLSGGEASLEDFEAKDGDDDEIDEGGSGEVASFEFDVEDADVELNRVDLSFSHTAVTGEEDEPWNTFDTITLMLNGEEIASEDVSDQDDWLDDDEDATTTFRFTGLDAIVEEGDRAELSVEVEVASSVDGANTTPTWLVEIEDDGVRGTDGEGLEQEIGDSGDYVSFDITEEGSGEELNVKTSADDVDASVLQVNDDETSDWYTVLVFELEAEEADIELDTLPVDFTVSTGEVVSSVINDVKLVIDGEEFDDFDWTGASDTFGSSTFDIDGDFTVGEGEEVSVEVMVEFASTNSGGYEAGDTVEADIAGANIDGEGSDDVVGDGDVDGETHTLQIAGINVELVSKSADGTSVDSSDNDYAEFEIVVDVSAFEDDVFISENAATAFTFQIENASSGAVLGTSTATTTSVTSDASVTGGSYRVSEGDTEEFTFAATLNPLPANEGANYRFQLLTVLFATTTSGASSTWSAEPANEYQTAGVLIND